PTTSPTPLVSVGALLYASTLLDSACPGVHGAWSQDINARVTCNGTSTELANSLPPTFNYLAGMFLNGLADGSGIPNDYILQVEALPEPSSQGAFGVLFRNQPDQPGHRHNGTYALLLNPSNGTWQAVVYDDVSGLPTYFASGQFAFATNASMIIDILVRENTFTFYLNGVLLGQVTGPSNPNYSSGTIGFAVSTNTATLFKNIAIYVLPA
ncbi:MAG: family 16 glycoside hydrolase, partial [Ktedonobacteraceae bacterium]